MSRLVLLSVFVPLLVQAAIHPVFDHASDAMKEQLNYSALTPKLGINNDCNETPITYSELESLALSAKDQIDFIHKLNETGAMQSFTIMFHSESAQAAGISEQWPGVLRSTVDSKIIFRYICDKKATELYDRVELIHFREETEKEPAQHELVEFDFTKPKNRKAERVLKNPSFCIDCHAAEAKPDQIRPNWKMYADWEGVFGSHDDIFEFWDRTNLALVNEKKEERKKFHKFIQENVVGNSNPCYASLPWPAVMKESNNYEKQLPAGYVNFPYGIEKRSRNYTVRPNLKYTETLSHLQGVKNFSRMKFLMKEDLELRKKVLLMLALEAAKCDRLIDNPYPSAAIDKNLHILLPKYERPSPGAGKIPMLRGKPTPQHEPRHPLGMAQALYGVSMALGLYPMDWTLLFIEYDRSDYDAGGGFGGTGLGSEEHEDPFPSSYGDYNRFLNQYAKQVAKDESPEVVQWLKSYQADETIPTFGDLPLTAYTQNEILKEVAKLIPDLKPHYWERSPLSQWKTESPGVPASWWFTTTRAEEEWFGPGFACIDDITGAPAFRDDKARESVCKVLRETAVAWKMDESLPRALPKPRGIEAPRMPPTRLAAFHRYLQTRMPRKADRDRYILTPQGVEESKSPKFIDFVKKSYRRR